MPGHAISEPTIQCRPGNCSPGNTGANLHLLDLHQIGMLWIAFGQR